MSASVASRDRASSNDVNLGARCPRRLVVVLLAPFFLVACGKGSVESVRRDAMQRLEQLAFVPPGRPALVQSSVRDSSQLVVEEPLLVGMYEVTRGEFREFLEDTAAQIDPLLRVHFERWQASEDALPVSFVTREEAAEYANWAGLRLLNSAEWLFCALSPRTLAYPWADSWQQGRANTLELGLSPYALTPVGTFEGGRTATRLYDMLGNVWEWVSDDLRPAADPRNSGSVFGGSYLTHKRAIYGGGEFFAQFHVPSERFDDVGLRVGAFAREWLQRHAAELERAANASARLEAVGRRWGSSAVPLLSAMLSSARDGASRAVFETLLSGARR